MVVYDTAKSQCNKGARVIRESLASFTQVDCESLASYVAVAHG